MRWIRARILFVLFVALLGAGILLFFIVSPHVAPWAPQGTLVVVTRAVPVLDTGSVTAFGFGIDDVTLRHEDGDTSHASILTRRVLLDLHQTTLTTLLDTRIPVGTYTMLDMRLTSPELRNAEYDDTAPAQVSLPFEHVTLPISYRIEEDAVTVILIGFETLQAVHDGAYLPVMQVETRTGATVRVDENGQVYVEGGSIVSNATYGMDWTGVVRQNFRAQRKEESAEHVSNESVSTSTAPVPGEVSENMTQEQENKMLETTGTTTPTASSTGEATTTDVRE